MLSRKIPALIICAALAMTLFSFSSWAADEEELIIQKVEESDSQHVLQAVSKDIIEADGLMFKDLNGNGELDVYEDWRESAEDRAEDLISQMTVREKISQMQHPTFVPKSDGSTPSYLSKWSKDEDIGFILVRELKDVATAVSNLNQVQAWAEESRLGIPVIISMDSVHGTSYVTGATVTPHNLGLAATRDKELVSELADMARQEHIAIGARMTLSPEADIATEPRWGRVMETFGEDADFVAEMTTAQVIGFQNGSDGLNEDSIIACMKHFPGAGPQMDGVDMAPIISTEESLEEHLKPYKAAIEVGLASVMPYYSIPLALDTVAALGSEATLQDLLRDELGFDGIIQTDWGMIWGIQQSASLWGDEVSEEEAVLIGVMEGQVDGIGGESIRLIDTMEELYEAGSITDEVLDAACFRILRAKFQMGLFEDPYADAEYAVSYVGNEENQALSLRAAEESMTLLKNDGILPLESGKKILVCGQRAGDMDSLCGGWSSAQEGLTVADAIAQYAGEDAEVTYVAEDLDEISAKAKEADVVICAIGEASYMHSSPWGADSLEITAVQQEMLETVKATGTAMITVVITGRPIILTWCDENTDAVLMAYYPGSQGGIAIAETLFGINNPTGQLPVQMPRDMESVLNQESDIAFDIEDPLYDYGFGLSYE